MSYQATYARAHPDSKIQCRAQCFHLPKSHFEIANYTRKRKLINISFSIATMCTFAIVADYLLLPRIFLLNTLQTSDKPSMLTQLFFFIVSLSSNKFAIINDENVFCFYFLKYFFFCLANWVVSRKKVRMHRILLIRRENFN